MGAPPPLKGHPLGSRPWGPAILGGSSAFALGELPGGLWPMPVGGRQPWALPREESPGFWTRLQLAKHSEARGEVWQDLENSPPKSFPSLLFQPVKAGASVRAAQERGSPARFAPLCPFLVPLKLPHSHLQVPAPPRKGSH